MQYLIKVPLAIHIVTGRERMQAADPIGVPLRHYNSFGAFTADRLT